MRGELKDRSFSVGREHGVPLIRQMGTPLLFPKKKLSKWTPGPKIYPYLLRNREISRAGAVWSADVTYHPMARGFCYLACIMDSPQSAGAFLPRFQHPGASFCIEALEEARERFPAPLVMNTDQGSQLTLRGLHRPSCGPRDQDQHGRPGSRWLDSVMIERLWISVQYEEVYVKAYKSIPKARKELGLYFDFYNQRRRHQGLRNRTPDKVYWSTLQTE